jgi:hypothetical protein
VTVLGQKIIDEAAKRHGIPYRINPPPDGVTTMDCSLFVKLTLEDVGAPLGASVRTAEQIRQACDPISLDAVERGDLLFFEGTYDAAGPAGPDGHIASHVGFSLGRGTQRMWDCHASGESGPPGVGETDISTQYWQSKLFQAGRPRVPARYQVVDDGVRLRAQAGTGPAAEVTVPNLGRGTTVTAVSEQTVDADGHTWRNVRTSDGKVGWVASEFLRTAVVVDGALTDDADHVFGFEVLWPYIQASAAKYGADAEVIAAIMKQESGFANIRVHNDGTGHGLFGLDDNGLLADFEKFSGLSCGRGQTARSIPPLPQIDYCARTIAAYTSDPEIGTAINAARAWHRGGRLWRDEFGQIYEDLVRGHIQTLFHH